MPYCPFNFILFAIQAKKKKKFLQEGRYSKLCENVSLRNASSLNYRSQVMNAVCNSLNENLKKANWPSRIGLLTITTAVCNQSLGKVLYYPSGGNCLLLVVSALWRQRTLNPVWSIACAASETAEYLCASGFIHFLLSISSFMHVQTLATWRLFSYFSFGHSHFFFLLFVFCPWLLFVIPFFWCDLQLVTENSLLGQTNYLIDCNACRSQRHLLFSQP